MKKNLKIVVFLIAFIMSISVACGGIPHLMPTEIPTQAPLPTYTSQPTYTPYPTEVPPVPTSIPDVEESNPYEGFPAPDGIESYNCPESDFPDGASNAECYTFANGKGLGVIYFDAYGKLWGIGAAFYEKDDIAYEMGVFLGWAGITHGMSDTDLVGVIESIEQPDKTYTYGTVKARTTTEDGKVAFIIQPVP